MLTFRAIKESKSGWRAGFMGLNSYNPTGEIHLRGMTWLSEVLKEI